jgi:CcmD family protein
MIPSNSTFIIAAYTVAWVVILGYLVRLIRMKRRAETELSHASRVHDAKGVT